MSGSAATRSQSRENERIALVGAVAWPAFFSAGVATMVFFAFVDPSQLSDIAWPYVRVPRGVGYTLGFFMFWAATLGACSFTALLLLWRPRNK